MQRNFWIKIWALCIPTLNIIIYNLHSFLILSCGIILFDKGLLLHWIICHYKMTALRKFYFSFMSVIINLDEDKQCRTFKRFTKYFHTYHCECLCVRLHSVFSVSFHLIFIQLNEGDEVTILTYKWRNRVIEILCLAQ